MSVMSDIVMIRSHNQHSLADSFSMEVSAAPAVVTSIMELLPSHCKCGFHASSVRMLHPVCVACHGCAGAIRLEDK